MSGRNNMIIFEDESYIICHKRAGIPTQTADLRSMDLMHERAESPETGIRIWD